MSFLLENIPGRPAIEHFIDLSFAISERVLQLLTSKGITPRELAFLRDEPEPLISQWLGGNYNLTLIDLARLETALGERLIEVPGLQAQ